MWRHAQATRFTETDANRNAVARHVRYWSNSGRDATPLRQPQ